MKTKKKNKKMIGIKMIKIIIITCLALFLYPCFIIALPVPHGVEGTIYELDGITQVRKGIDFYVHNVDENHIVQGKTGQGGSGKYSVALKGNDGDLVLVKAWNKYNQANISFNLNGVMYNVDLLLNMTYPPLAPNITSNPITNATEKQNYIYNVEAFDENEDLLEYTLLVNPQGMNINYDNGTITWVPSKSDIGNNSVVVQVSDGNLTDQQEFIILVYEDPSKTYDKNDEDSDNEIETDGNKETSSSGGGGGSFNRQLTNNRIKSATAKKVELKIKELKNRPQNVAKIPKRVYKYLSIEDLNNAEIEEININFKVELEWLNEKGLRDNDIVLSRYTREGWKDLETRDTKKDDKFVYYTAKTKGFSYFAITVKEGVFVNENVKYSSSNLKKPFHISGMIYDLSTKQVKKSTKFLIENLDNPEVVEGETGIGPNTGAYSVIVHGKIGDKLRIKIGNDDKLFTERLEEKRNLDFFINEGEGFLSITGAAVLKDIKINKQIIPVTILITTIILSLIFIRFKYNEDD